MKEDERIKNIRYVQSLSSALQVAEKALQEGLELATTLDLATDDAVAAFANRARAALDHIQRLQEGEK